MYLPLLVKTTFLRRSTEPNPDLPSDSTANSPPNYYSNHLSLSRKSENSDFLSTPALREQKWHWCQWPKPSNWTKVALVPEAKTVEVKITLIGACSFFLKNAINFYPIEWRNFECSSYILWCVPSCIFWLSWKNRTRFSTFSTFKFCRILDFRLCRLFRLDFDKPDKRSLIHAIRYEWIDTLWSSESHRVDGAVKF